MCFHSPAILLLSFDCLIHHQKDTLAEIFHYVRRLLSSLGFIVKLEKCFPALTRHRVFLGALLTVYCPASGTDRSNTGSMPGMLDCQSTSMGELSSLLGRRSHVAWTGWWVATLHYRDLHCQQAVLLYRIGWKPKHRISLSHPSLRDLTW